MREKKIEKKILPQQLVTNRQDKKSWTRDN